MRYFSSLATNLDAAAPGRIKRYSCIGGPHGKGMICGVTKTTLCFIQ
jgi:hypothetical protein